MLGEKFAQGLRTIPQRLKPDSFCDPYGTSKLAPFQSVEFLTKL
jgi:hypothetical protein